MSLKKIGAILLLFVGFQMFAQASSVDTLSLDKGAKFQYKELIIPSILIGYGIIGNESQTLQDFNLQIRNKTTKYFKHSLTIDNYAQYAPALAVYGLNALGVEGKHSFRDRTVILASAYLFMGITVNTMKYTFKIERPDFSAFNSFPSGHTATAFMTAEFLRQEYKEVSQWYGIVGYTVATGAGLFRIRNNRHWFTDVMAGACVGILSTKLAYLIHPWLNTKLFKDKKSSISASVLPFYNGRQAGLGLAMSF